MTTKSDADDDWCDGLPASLAVDFVNINQYYSELVSDIDIMTVPSDDVIVNEEGTSFDRLKTEVTKLNNFYSTLKIKRLHK